MTDAVIKGDNFRVQPDQIEVFEAFAQLDPSCNTWNFIYTRTLWSGVAPRLKIRQYPEIDIRHRLDVIFGELPNRTSRAVMLVVSPVIATMMYSQNVMSTNDYRRVVPSPCRLDFPLVEFDQSPLFVRVPKEPLRDMYVADGNGSPV